MSHNAVVDYRGSSVKIIGTQYLADIDKIGRQASVAVNIMSRPVAYGVATLFVPTHQHHQEMLWQQIGPGLSLSETEAFLRLFSRGRVGTMMKEKVKGSQLITYLSFVYILHTGSSLVPHKECLTKIGVLSLST